MGLAGTHDDLLLRVLGPVATASPGTDARLTPVRGQQGEVLSVLAAAYPDAVRTDALVQTLWSDAEHEKDRRAGLGVVMHRLRDRLGRGRDSISNEAGTYRLTIESYHLDHLVFLAEVDKAETELSDNDPEAAARLTDALALWRGECFEPFMGSPLVVATAQYLSERRSEAEETLLESLLHFGRHDDAATWGTQFVETQPYRERRWELLMLALYRSGRQAEALGAARRISDLLLENLGVDPGPAIQRLEVEILNQSPALDGPPEVHEVGVGQFVRSLQSAAGQIPLAANSFIGRANEVRDLAATLDDCRLVTIVGPPGAGKSRLAAHHARGSIDERVVWVDLAGLTSTELIPELVRVLGVQGGDDVAAAIRNALNQQDTLLVLDNAQRIREEIVEVTEALLANCPHLRVVATSQVALGSLQEVTMSLDCLEPAAARGLLLDRAFGPNAAPQHSTRDLDQLVDQLDAMPLHLELVAPALRTTTPCQLADQLQTSLAAASAPTNTNARHRSLDTTLDRAVELLPEQAQGLYDIVGVFSGSFTLIDLSELTERPIDELRAPVATLAQHFMLSPDRDSTVPSYRQPAAMRTHARERLRVDGNLDALQERHASRYFDLLRDARAGLRSDREAAIVARLRPSSGQLRTTHRWFIEQGNAERSAEFAINMWEYSFLRQHFDRYGWAAEALELPGCEQLDTYPELLGVASMSAWASNDHVAAISLASRACRAAETQSSPPPMNAIRSRFNVAAQTGRIDEASDILATMFVESHKRNDDHEVFNTLVTLALGQVQLGDIDGAKRSAAQALELAEATGNPSNVAWANYAEGTIEHGTNPDRAARLFSASSRLARTVDNQWVHGMASTSLVTCLRHQGRTQQAARLLRDVLGLWGRSQNHSQIAHAGQEVVLLLAALHDHQGAAEALAHVDLLDQVHPLLPHDQLVFDALRTELHDADPLVDHDPSIDLATTLANLLPESADA